MNSFVGYRFSVHGRVQGVGFRDFVQREARRRQLTGYVRNLPEGSVLICAVGTADQIAELESLIRQGPRGALVHSVAVEEMETDGFEDFRIVL